jgi:hypothetical protein
MTIELNHTIVPANDPKASARFLADILAALAACLIRLVASPGW